MGKNNTKIRNIKEKVKAYLRKGAQRMGGYEEYPNVEVGWGEDVIIRLH